MNDVNVLVLTGYGLNCDHETAHSVSIAGGKSHRVHINSVLDQTVAIDQFQIIVLGGGFSWGDDHGAGVIEAVRLKKILGESIIEFVEKGNLVLGICNGFQTLVNMGLLPGFDGDYQTRSVAVTYNDCGNFRNDWIRLKINPASPCIFTKGLDQIELPVRHGEGKFYSTDSITERLFQNNQVAVQYAMSDGSLANGRFPYNPNGSIHDIAGICDPTGRIFGLMPHPEAFNHPTNHPDWLRKREIAKRRGERMDDVPILGIRIFQNAVDAIKQNS
ncbi:MAG TPA: phosphoribosylformylglycinamidine synthase subunit PurQ [Desulfobacterales bacterium]|nr:phosphoribosylformylglycinamidine synthase subunit PurQ [Desulfobacterales bacterium]